MWLTLTKVVTCVPIMTRIRTTANTIARVLLEAFIVRRLNKLISGCTRRIEPIIRTVTPHTSAPEIWVSVYCISCSPLSTVRTNEVAIIAMNCNCANVFRALKDLLNSRSSDKKQPSTRP